MTFTAPEAAAIAPYFTNVDQPVFALVNLPETVKGALFARYSRSPKSLRRLFLDEFATSVAAAAPPAGDDVGVFTEYAQRAFLRERALERVAGRTPLAALPGEPAGQDEPLRLQQRPQHSGVGSGEPVELARQALDARAVVVPVGQAHREQAIERIEGRVASVAAARVVEEDEDLVERAVAVAAPAEHREQDGEDAVEREADIGRRAEPARIGLGEPGGLERRVEMARPDVAPRRACQRDRTQRRRRFRCDHAARRPRSGARNSRIAGMPHCRLRGTHWYQSTGSWLCSSMSTISR